MLFSYNLNRPFISCPCIGIVYLYRLTVLHMYVCMYVCMYVYVSLLYCNVHLGDMLGLERPLSYVICHYAK